MKLTNDQIRSITTGALRFWEKEGDLYFSRCTQKQLDAWYAIDEGLGMRGESTTGIRLDFFTSSKFFAFTVVKPAVFEIAVDELLSYHYDAADFDTLRKEITLDGKEHRITLYFPNHSIGALQAVELEDGATFTRPVYDRKFLFIGDSITQGWDSYWDSLTFAQELSYMFHADSVIQGIGGAVFHESTFDPEVPFDPEVVFVAYGTNDWGYYATLEELREHCALFLDRLVEKYPDKPIFAISPIWREDIDQPKAMGTFAQCTDIVKEQILAHNLILLDGMTMVPHSMKFYADAVHPNALGFGIYAIRLAAELQKRL